MCERMTSGLRQSAGIAISILVCVWGCGQEAEDSDTLFVRLSADSTGIRFANTLHPTEELNTYSFRNFYNGGGVAIGDLNNDGLADIVLTGNQVSNRIYLNKGDLTFQDITREAGLESEGVWSTGVSMADVNGDGWIDIYICKSGPPGGENRHNELYINNADNTFTEKAEEYGIAVTGLSIHASFFDYDRDGDLDMYLLSNPIRSVDELRRQPGLRSIRDPNGGNKLFRNELIPHDMLDGGTGGEEGVPRFTDVSADAGIYSSRIGFGLGVSVADVNRDGSQDIYVSNDFFERDYLYINKRDGTFEDVLPQLISETSLSSMGGDIADLNNDGYPEIFVSDMLPERIERAQSKMSFSTWDEYAATVDDGYHHQFSRNTLQLNRGPIAAASTHPDTDVVSTPVVFFSEIGRLAGVEATDWSWGGLFADLDLDGHRDLFVPNGIYKDLLDQDFITRVSDPGTLRNIMTGDDEPIMRILDELPSNPIPNYAFAGSFDLNFRDSSAAWGLSEPGFSNGSSYGDLDNDGDLDLVVSNVNMEAFVYLNRAAERYPDRSWLQVELEGRSPNNFAVGAQLTAWSDERQWYVEQVPVRGFQSTVDHTLHIGLGTEIVSGRLDSLVVRWPDGQSLMLTDVPVNQRLVLEAPDEASSFVRISAGD